MSFSISPIISNLAKAFTSNIAPVQEPADSAPLAALAYSLLYSRSNTSRSILFMATPSPVQCGGDEGNKLDDILHDGGIILNQPDAADDAHIVLPTNDAGLPVLPGEFYETIDATGSTDFINETKRVSFSTGIIGGENLQNTPLELVCGIDPRKIDALPHPADMCPALPVLTNVTPSIPEDGMVCYDTLDASGMPIPRAGYEDWAFCPDSIKGQIPNYYYYFKVICHQDTPAYENVVINIDPDAVLDATDIAEPVYPICGTADASALTVALSLENCNKYGSANVGVEVGFMADARPTPNANIYFYQTVYTCLLRAREE